MEENKESILAPRTTSVAITDGVRVSVTSQYQADQSDASAKRYVFAYTVRIANESRSPIQLKTRHWIITDASGKIEEVQGLGVVGRQPMLRPGESFQYTSGAVLQTQRGIMHGSYQMEREDGNAIDVEIAPFSLELPYTLN